MKLETKFGTPPCGKNSYFISFEGIEGSGKSTQIKSISIQLEQKGFRVLSLREPGGTVFGEKLREAILASENPLHPLAEAHLFAASRAQLLSEKIIPYLKQSHSIVILDRYIDSSLAYQGSARGLGLETVAKLHQDEPLSYLPHLTLYLKIDLNTSMERQQQRGQDKDYFEKENQHFYQKLIDGYDRCAEEFPQRIQVISAHNSPDQVQKDILVCIEDLCR